MSESVKLQKFIADAGICSRRAAERLIADGCVTVNGVTAAIGDRVVDDDEVRVKGKIVKPCVREHTYIMLNKPAGIVCTMSDESERRCVRDLLRDVPARVFPVGRLDMYSDGLLILTDDGELANSLSHPRAEKEKIYRVTLRGPVSDETIARLRRMRNISGDNGESIPILPCGIELLTRDDDETVVSMTLREGKNRQIRRMCSAVGVKIVRLTRVSFGGVELGGLPAGRWRALTDGEIETLRRTDYTK